MCRSGMVTHFATAGSPLHGKVGLALTFGFVGLEAPMVEALEVSGTLGFAAEGE